MSLLFLSRNREFMVCPILSTKGQLVQTNVEVGDKFLTHNFMATLHNSTECLFSSVSFHILNLTHSITVAVIPL